MTNADIAAAKRHAAKWVLLPHTKKELYDESRKHIAARTANAIRHGLRIDPTISPRMEYVSSWLGMLAVSRILDGNVEGWKDMQASFLYRVWELRITGGYQDTGQSKRVFDVWNSMLGFVHAMAIREDGFADWYGPRLLESLAGKNSKFRGWEDRPFEVFAVRLYALLRKIPAELLVANGVSLGIYQEILDHWHDPDALEEVIFQACEHHWNQTKDLDARGHVGAFSWAPYSTFPVEMIAIRRVREDLGLPTPDVSHPLMKSPLAVPPKTTPKVQDEVLDQLIAKARSEGIVGEPW